MHLPIHFLQRLHYFVLRYLLRVVGVENIILVQPIAANQGPLRGCQMLPGQGWLAYRGFLKCMFTKDYTGALIDFQRVAKLKPNGREMDHTYAFFEGTCELELGHYQRAEAAFAHDMALQRGSDGLGEIHFNTLFYAGVVAARLKQYAPAQAYLQQCLRAYPQHPEANYYLALIYQAQGQPALARQHLEAAQRALIGGYRLNEDNIFYANYPEQVTEFEVTRAMKEIEK